MGRATRRRPRPTGLNAGVFQGHRPPLTTPSTSCGCFLGGRILGAPGPSLIISLPALTSFLWYDRRTPYFTMPASLSRSDCSTVVLGAAAPTEPPSSSKATQRERSTGRYHFTAMGRASSAFIFSHLLGFGSAEDSSSQELPSPSNSSALSVLTVVLIAGLVALGETHWLSVHIFAIGPHVYLRVLSTSPCPLCISLSDCS